MPDMIVERRSRSATNHRPIRIVGCLEKMHHDVCTTGEGSS
jgi:hypothetical protein